MSLPIGLITHILEGGVGIEPTYPESQTSVLPLNNRPIKGGENKNQRRRLFSKSP